MACAHADRALGSGSRVQALQLNLDCLGLQTGTLLVAANTPRVAWQATIRLFRQQGISSTTLRPSCFMVRLLQACLLHTNRHPTEKSQHAQRLQGAWSAAGALSLS